VLLKRPESNDLIRIIDVDELMNPHAGSVKGRSQSGEEEQEITDCPIAGLILTINSKVINRSVFVTSPNRLLNHPDAVGNTFASDPSVSSRTPAF
jgi:hypothetical protein